MKTNAHPILLALAIVLAGWFGRPAAVPQPVRVVVEQAAPRPPGPVDPAKPEPKPGPKPEPPASKYGLTEAVASAARRVPASPARTRGLGGAALAFRTTLAQPIADAKALAADLKGRMAFWVPAEEHDAIGPVFDAINARLNALTKDGTLVVADDYRAAFREVLAGLEASR